MIRFIAALFFAAFTGLAFAQAPPSGGSLPVQTAKTANYALLASDLGSLIPFNCSAPCTVTLPAANVASWPKGYPVQIQSIGSATVAIHPTSPSTIYGGMALTSTDVQLTAAGNYAVLNADTAGNYAAYGQQGSPTASSPGSPTGGAQWNSAGSFAGSSGLTLNSTKITGMSMGLGSDATGDTYYGGAGGAFTRLPKGTDGQVMQLASGLPSWVTPSAGGVVTSIAGQIPVYNDTTHVTGSANLTFTGSPLLLKFDTNASQALPSWTSTTQPSFTLVAPDTVSTRLGVLSFNAANGSTIGVMAAAGTAGGTTAAMALGNGVRIGRYQFWAHDGTALNLTAGITADTTQVQTNANHGTKVTISTTPNNSIVLTDAVTIDETQNITVAGQAGAGNRCIHVDLNGKQTPTPGDCRVDTVVAKTGSYTVATTDSGATFTNSGAATLTLPLAANIPIGFSVCFVVAVASDLIVQAPTGVHIAIGETNSSAAGALTIGKGSGADVPFASQCLTEISATQWISKGGSGSWSLS